MALESAASRDGYYYIGPSVISKVSGYRRFIYYFDMGNLRSYPLCSKLDCTHSDGACDACLQAGEGLDSAVWYYDGRII